MRALGIGLLLLAACGNGKSPPAGPITLLDQAPPDALELHVTARRWICDIQLPDGWEDHALHVPVGQAVHLIATSAEAPPHDRDLAITLGGKKFPIRARKDTHVVFRVDQPGRFEWKCPTVRAPDSPRDSAVLTLFVDDRAAYDAYLGSLRIPDMPETMVAAGKDIFERKGCSSCHSVDGSPKIGVSMAKLWATKVELNDGRVELVDAGFIERALKTPAAYVRPSYPPSMPTFDGVLKPKEIAQLAVYIESLR